MTKTDFKAWLEGAECGDQTVYAVLHPGHEHPDSGVLNAAMSAYIDGHVMLFQRRATDTRIEYVARRTAREVQQAIDRVANVFYDRMERSRVRP